MCAADRVTVHALAARARAARVAAGEVEAGGTPAGGHRVGVGDEIVTLRNDRRLTTTRDGWVRNGDRWTVQARGDDGSLTVEDLNGRGRTTLPGDYVADQVTLGYAVTIHKAQGVTVDHTIVIVDERTTAEALYVGMTRGRTTNTALAVCDDLDLDHPPTGPSPTPTQVMVAALGRVSAERAALDVQGDTRPHTESLPILTARLFDLNAWIAQAAPSDQTRELERAERDLERARQHCRPGHLTRAGREDRRHLDAAQAHHDGLLAAQRQRDHWLSEHADVLARRDQLAHTVSTRRREQGAARVAERVATVIADREASRADVRPRIAGPGESGWGSETLRHRQPDLDLTQDHGIDEGPGMEL